MVSKTARSVTSRRSSDIGVGASDERRREHALLDLALQAARFALLRILDQHRAQHVLRFEVALFLVELLRRRDLHAVARVGLELLQAGARAGVAGVVLLHPLIERGRGVRMAARAQQLGLPDPLRAEYLADTVVLRAVVEPLRVLARGALEQHERLLAAPGGDVVARFGEHRVEQRGAARYQQQSHQEQRHEPSHHIPFPSTGRR